MVTYYLALTALFVFIVFVLYYNWTRRYLYLAANKLKGPPALPIVGNGLMFMCKNEDILMKIYEIMKADDQEPIRFWLGPKLLICFPNPNHVEKILASPKFAYKHEIYDFIKPYLGNGLVSGSGPLYKQHRKIIQPMFDLNFAKESTCVIQKHVNICMDKLEKFVNQGTFDFHSVVHKCMVDVIKEIVLGSNERCQENGLTDFDQAMLDVYDFGFTRLVKPWLHPDIIFNNSPLKKRQDAIRSTLRELGSDVVTNSWKRRKLLNTTHDFYSIIDRIADYIEEHPGVIDSEHFVDHVLTLHAAAEDTFTIISCFLSLCFGMYPEYQEKAAAEIRDVFGDTPRPVTTDDINRLNYIDMCLKDALRLFPIAPVILRKCTGDFQLENWMIPNGCAIVVPIFNIHRSENYWENPHHFYPDHFIPEIANKRHTYAYVPFSAGPRGCIGKILANAGLKIFICNLLQRFEVEADGKLPDLELRMDISVRPKCGYHLRLKKRIWK